MANTMGPLIGKEIIENNDHRIVSLIVIFLIIGSSIGVFYFAYMLFLKDIILLLKEKRRRTTVESGFRIGTGNQSTVVSDGGLN